MPDIDPHAQTELLPRPRITQQPAAAEPVFVDSSGRRRRAAHRIALAFLLAAGGYAVMVVWSLLGGPVAPDTLMPFSAPHSAASTPATVRASATAADPTAAASTAASPRSTYGAAAAASSAASSPTGTRPSSAAPTASSAGRRPSSAPGKPTSTATGHGH